MHPVNHHVMLPLYLSIPPRSLQQYVVRAVMSLLNLGHVPYSAEVSNNGTCIVDAIFFLCLLLYKASRMRDLNLDQDIYYIVLFP